MTRLRSERPQVSLEMLKPWRWAEQFNVCWLYWLPSTTFPMVGVERRWILQFLDRLDKALGAGFDLEPKQFLENGLLPPSERNLLLKSAMDMQTFPGVSRSFRSEPGRPELGSCVWFPGQQHSRQRELFFGYGAMTIWYVAKDKAAQAPPTPVSPAMRSHPMFARIFETINVDEMFSNLFRIQHRALAKSRQLAADLTDSAPEVRGTAFILPILSSRDFFQSSQDQIGKWFDVFDVYLREIPGDSGILLATKTDLSPLIVELVHAMRTENIDRHA